MGILLGAIYWYSGSLWAAIIAHFIYDAFFITLTYFQPQLIQNTEATLINPSQRAIMALFSAAIIVAIVWWMKKICHYLRVCTLVINQMRQKRILLFNMAFHWQTFRTRALTAIVFVAVMALGLLWSRWSFFILFSAIHFGCWVEYQNLVTRFNKDYNLISPFHKYGVMLGGWCLMLYFTNNELQLFGIRLTEVGWWAGLVLLILIPLMIFIESKKFF